eukprot:TRINITY_DN76925_c0_g1_i1.p3 TRINITY_DN76925_c0_g1~~TRINITY_DN76925_c0_g1_i1.p3  ORF type:complete len:160 (+),score=10.12 TRINITY_DN76925_c0_g1_i1:67-480(+)
MPATCKLCTISHRGQALCVHTKQVRAEFNAGTRSGRGLGQSRCSTRSGDIIPSRQRGVTALGAQRTFRDSACLPRRTTAGVPTSAAELSKGADPLSLILLLEQALAYCCRLLSWQTFDDGYLGSRTDEGRSEMRPVL